MPPTSKTASPEKNQERRTSGEAVTASHGASSSSRPRGLRWWILCVALSLIVGALCFLRVPQRCYAISLLNGLGADVEYKIDGPIRGTLVRAREAIRDWQTRAPFTMPDFAGVLDWPPLKAMQGEITSIVVEDGDLFSTAPVVSAVPGADMNKLTAAVRLSPRLKYFSARGDEFSPTGSQMHELARALGEARDLRRVSLAFRAQPVLDDTGLELLLRSHSIGDLSVSGSQISEAGLAVVDGHPTLILFSLEDNKGATQRVADKLMSRNAGKTISIAP